VQWLPVPQSQCPSAHAPLQSGLSPTQETWQGPEPHAKSQVAPSSHVQVPSEQVAVHDELDWQSMLHGGDEQSKWQDVPCKHPHITFEQSAVAWLLQEVTEETADRAASNKTGTIFMTSVRPPPQRQTPTSRI
jgi:hypothetical protein